MYTLTITANTIEDFNRLVTGLYKDLNITNSSPVETKSEEVTLEKKKPGRKPKQAETVDIEELIEETIIVDTVEAEELEDESETVLDSETVKELAKTKIADGKIGREEVKAETKKLGAEKISDLKGDALVKLYEKLKAAA